VNGPGFETQCDGTRALAKEKGIEVVEVPVDQPISDYNSLAIKLAQDAGGPTGAVLPAFTSDVLVQLFPAIAQQGLIDKAIWYEGATGSQDDVLAALGSDWDGSTYFAQSEFAPPQGGGPDQQLYRDVIDKYNPDDPKSNFGDMGFLAARWLTEALLRVQASGQELTQETVNAEIRNLVGLQTDILCKEWYFGDLKSHIPNNGSYFLTPQGGVFQPVPGGGCGPNPMTDPIIAQAYLDEIGLGIPQLPGTPTQAEIEAYLASQAG
jgi:branched-chain amino acid transport system substrate-binding protein